MVKVIRRTVYFMEPGRDNTEDVAEAVRDRIETSKMETVVVASHRGSTALKFGEKLSGKVNAHSVCNL